MQSWEQRYLAEVLDRLPHGVPPTPDDRDGDDMDDKPTNDDVATQPYHSDVEPKELEQEKSDLLTRFAEKSLEASCKRVVGKALVPFQSLRH